MFRAFDTSVELLKATWECDEQKVAELLEDAHNQVESKSYHDEKALSFSVQLAYYAAQKYYTTILELASGKGYADLAYLPSPKYPEGAVNETYAVPEGVETIDEREFVSSVLLKTIIVPQSVKTIENEAFRDCSSLTEVVLSEGLNKIDSAAFENCPSLTEIVVPASVVEIGDAAFSGCSSLTKIFLPKSVNAIGYDVFKACPLLTIRAPKGSYAEQYAKENNIPFEPID